MDGDVELHLESLLDHGCDLGHLGPHLAADIQEGPGEQCRCTVSQTGMIQILTRAIMNMYVMARTDYLNVPLEMSS